MGNIQIRLEYEKGETKVTNLDVINAFLVESLHTGVARLSMPATSRAARSPEMCTSTEVEETVTLSRVLAATLAATSAIWKVVTGSKV